MNHLEIQQIEINYVKRWQMAKSQLIPYMYLSVSLMHNKYKSSHMVAHFKHSWCEIGHFVLQKIKTLQLNHIGDDSKSITIFPVFLWFAWALYNTKMDIEFSVNQPQLFQMQNHPLMSRVKITDYSK